MKSEKDVPRRDVLGLIGAFGASVVAGCGGGDSPEASVSPSSATSESATSSTLAKGTDGSAGTTLKPGGCSQGLEFPHTASTATDTVAAHAVAQLSGSADAIVSTVSQWDQNFAFLKSNSDGTIGFFKTLVSMEEVRQFFAVNVTQSANPGGEQRLNELSGRWYDLVDSRYNQKILPNGPTLTGLRGIFLFLTWPDGIIGDIFWAEPTWVQAFDVEAPTELTHKLIAYEDAWRSGNVEARLATIEDETRSVIRVASLTDAQRSRFIASTKSELRAAWSSQNAGTVLELERLHHVVSTYYVFAAHRVVLKVNGRKVVRETATLLPLGPNRKFVGELSYSFESKL